MPSRPKVFRAQHQPTPQQSKAEYEQRRGSARERGYGHRWDQTSAGFKRRHQLCLGCEAVGRVTATTTTDHVVPHKGNMAIFWDASRWQPACDWHHSAVKQQLEGMFERGEITEADLWLNSAAAMRLTIALTP